MKHKTDFDGELAQVTEFLSKSTRAADRKKSQINRRVACTVIIEVKVKATPHFLCNLFLFAARFDLESNSVTCASFPSKSVY